jgi:hypothetical protein
MALLPLGRKYACILIVCYKLSFHSKNTRRTDTDGGRITLAMFGRRGAYLIKTFAAIALCFLGLVGLDESRLLISYTAFVYLCQRELEAPMLNEVDQVDDGRAVIGFLTGILVTLVLLPMPQ